MHPCHKVQKGKIFPSAKSTEPSFVNESTHDSSNELARGKNCPLPKQGKPKDLASGKNYHLPAKEKSKPQNEVLPKNDDNLAKAHFDTLPKKESSKDVQSGKNYHSAKKDKTGLTIAKK